MTALLRSLVIAALGGLLAPAASADDKVKPPPSLDDELLKGLSKDEPAELKPLPPRDAEPAKKPTATDEELLKRLTAGEDLGESGNPLIRIGNKMRRAEGLLGQAKPSEEAQALQLQIVSDLDQLIKQMQQQKCKNPSAKSSSSSGGQRNKTNPQQNASSGKGQNDIPARESTDKLRDKQSQEAEIAERKKLLQNLWGDLPEREREQLLNTTSDQFLPKYQLLLEKYFRRLGEQQAP